MNYRLTRKAQRDLENVYRYSLQNFGEAKADEYFDGLSDFFTLLAEHPFMGQDYGFINTGITPSITNIETAHYADVSAANSAD